MVNMSLAAVYFLVRDIIINKTDVQKQKNWLAHLVDRNYQRNLAGIKMRIPNYFKPHCLAFNYVVVILINRKTDDQQLDAFSLTQY